MMVLGLVSCAVILSFFLLLGHWYICIYLLLYLVSLESLCVCGMWVVSICDMAIDIGVYQYLFILGSNKQPRQTRQSRDSEDMALATSAF